MKRNDQPHSYNASLRIWKGFDRKYGMKINIENIDNCCSAHAYSSAVGISQSIVSHLDDAWGPHFRYEVIEIKRNW